MIQYKKTNRKGVHKLMKRLFAVLLCLAMLLGSVTVFAENGTVSAPRANVTDNKPPEIVKFTFPENGKTLKPGDKIHLSLRLDDRSTVSQCYGYIVNEEQNDWREFWMEYDPKTDMFCAEYELTAVNGNGEYIVRGFHVVDGYNNYLDCTNEKKVFGSFTFKGGVTYKDNLKLSAKIRENGQTVVPYETIHIDIKLEEKCTYASEYAEATIASANGSYRTTVECYYNPDTGSYTGEYEFSDNRKNGKYLLKHVNVYGVHDERVIASKDITGQSVTLKEASEESGEGGEEADTTPPKITSLTLKENGKTLKPGDKLHISAKITDASDIYAEAGVFRKDTVSYQDEDGTVKNKSVYDFSIYGEYNSATKTWEAEYTLPDYMPNGAYKIWLSVWDDAGNSAGVMEDKPYFIFEEADFVYDGLKAFITECWKAIKGKNPTAAEVKKYGLPVAKGEQNAADVILTLVQKNKLTGKKAATAIYTIMQGKAPGAAELKKTKKALKKGLEYAIDSLNNAKFRERCRTWHINPGSFGTKAADLDTVSVNAEGGHYILTGKTATFTGPVDVGVKKLVIQDTVTANGRTYKVTKIEGAACKGLKKLTSLTIGKNVTTIGQFAFSDCGKLKTVTILGTKLKTFGAGCFENISSKPVFKCPKKKLSAYKKKILGSGKAPRKSKFK